jgi:hypothetical protein
MGDNELLTLVKEYIANIEIIARKNVSIDLFQIEDVLNRTLSVDLFVVALADKVNFVLNQPRVSVMLVGA